MTSPQRNHDTCSSPRTMVRTSLGYRILFGVGMLLVACMVTWVGGRSFSALVALACVGMIFEWTRLVQEKAFTLGFYIVTVLALISIFLATDGYYAAAYVGAILSSVVLAQQHRALRWAGLAVGYIIASCIALIWLRALPDQGRLITFVLFVSVWATDIGAYSIGKMMGGALLAPTISPQKTWAGAVGGAISGAVCAGGVGFLASAAGTVHLFFLIGAGLSLATILGDLIESAVKRRFGVKDMSGVIPGHGGVLDRLDGMILGTIVLAVVLYGYRLM